MCDKKENRGREIEDLVEDVCKIMFLSDFTVRNPKYKKTGGREKEAADFLVPFCDHLIAFQVKSKTEIKSATDKDEKDFERINSKTEEGIAQLNTIKKALSANIILELKNSLGIDIPFDNKSVKKLIGIVIIDLIGEEIYPPKERTEIFNGFVYHKEIPVHIFLRNNFDLIATEIDTLPDFIEYLNKREILYSKQQLGTLTSELDFLAVYKTRHDLINGCLEGKCDFLVIEKGIWKQYIDTHRRKIEERNYLNKPSYFVDHIINTIHSAINYIPNIKLPPIRKDLYPGTTKNYWETIVELSKLTRLERRTVGKSFLDRIKTADRTGYAQALLKLDEESALLLISTNRNRQQKTNALYNLSAIAYCHLGLKRVVGIATQPLSAKKRSYDTIVLRNVTFENHDELAERFKTSFKKPMQHFDITEYEEIDKPNEPL